MLKNLGSLLAAIVVAVVLVFYMCTFEVRFTEVAIKKTWGKPEAGAITEPGLKFKWPPPIQTAVVYDKRLRIMEDRTEETRTVDGKNLVVTTYTLWRIEDPSKFHTNFPGGVEDGERKLRTAVVAHKNAVIARHGLNEFVSTDPTERKMQEIEREIEQVIAQDVSKAFGIGVTGFGIKKLGYPESNSTAVFQSMKVHEEAKASRYQAEGEARASEILANAKASKERILAAARQKVAEIESEAERVVSGYYKEFDKHPDLRIFLDKLRTVAEALRNRTTLIITHETSPFDVFDQQARDRIADGDAKAPSTATRKPDKKD